MAENRNALQSYYRLLAQKCLDTLKPQGIEGIYVENKASAVNAICEMVPEDATVSKGGSLTLAELGILDTLKEKGCHLIDPAAGKGGAEIDALAHEAIASDVYLMSANALAATGEIVNIDGIGNRAAALCYGPKKVIIIAGVNKLTEDLHAAIQRAQGIASATTVLSYGQEFDTFDQLLSAGKQAGKHMLITRGSVIPKRIYLIIVGESLGF